MVRGPKARALAAALRRVRNDAGIRLVDLAERVGMSKSTLARIESGARTVSEVEVAKLLGALNLGGDEADAILQLAAEANSPNWLATGAGIPLQVATLVDYETSAKRIYVVTTIVVPGLLQTPDYAREVFRAGGGPLREVETQVRARLQRQSVLTRPDSPVELVAIIDEPVIHRMVGGREVAARQLRHIVTMIDRHSVQVQVIPYALGAHGAMSGSYEVIVLDDQPPVVHAENMFGGVFIDQAPQTLDTMLKVDMLRQSALSPAESAGLIRNVLDTMEST